MPEREAIPSIAEVQALLTAAGAPFEMEELQIRGVPTRCWKNALPSLREVLAASKVHGDAVFLVYEDERMSYAEHHRRVAGLAQMLRAEWGVQKGDRVAIAMRNYPEWPIAFWAAACAGAVVVPLNAWWQGGELEYGLSDSGAKLLFCDGERAQRLTPHLDGLAELSQLVVARGDALPPGAVDFQAALDAAPRDDALPELALSPEDEATIFYTSGTTGRPKGALGTHRNICGNLLSLAFTAARGALRGGQPLPGAIAAASSRAGAPAARSEVQRAQLLSVPFFHVTGCHSVLCSSLSSGAKLVMMHKWDAERALELIERERITNFGGVPSMVWEVVEHPRFGEFDVSSVQGVGYGGAPAAPELVRRIESAFPVSASSNGYGLTETSSVSTMNAGADYRRKPDSVGAPIAVCDVKIVRPDDGAGAALPVGEVGEVWIRGPNVVKGYWNKPEASAEAIVGGWLRSGDLGRLDEEGFLYIVDRAKDMVIRGGENVYCVEVESVLYGHPAVMDAAVIGLPHRVLGEEVGAVVALSPGRSADEAELRKHAAAQLASFKVPVRIEIRSEPLPRNANGKILKRQLKEEIAAG
ncbi:MAG: AMP-binding protein [Deltaproteobacteria bacterium]|nr:AMP-binding protein [Deltaproteobacteria bacterium]